MKRLVNITLECEHDEQAHFLDIFLRDNYKVLHFNFLPDTKNMYNEDVLFKGLVNVVKKATKAKDDYVHNHNEKYLK